MTKTTIPKVITALLAIIILIGLAGCQESSQGYVNSGNSKQLSKQYDAAIKDYTKAIEMDGKNTEAYFQRAKVYNFKDDKKNAIKDFQTVVELDPKGEKGKKAKQMVDELKQGG